MEEISDGGFSGMANMPIRRCGCGVAVSNALECVRDVVDYVTESNDKDGVAGFLTGLVSGKMINCEICPSHQHRRGPDASCFQSML